MDLTRVRRGFTELDHARLQVVERTPRRDSSFPCSASRGNAKGDAVRINTNEITFTYATTW